jgi:hypothetical protein
MVNGLLTNMLLYFKFVMAEFEVVSNNYLTALLKSCVQALFKGGLCPSVMEGMCPSVI